MELISFVVTLLTFCVVIYYFYQIKSVSISGSFSNQCDRIYDSYISKVFLINNRNNTVLIYSINLVFNKDIVLEIYNKDIILKPYSRLNIDDVEPFHSLYIGSDEFYLDPCLLFNVDTKLMLKTNFGYVFCSFPKNEDKFKFKRVYVNEVNINGHVITKNVKYVIQYKKYNDNYLYTAFVTRNGFIDREWDYPNFIFKEYVSVDSLKLFLIGNDLIKYFELLVCYEVVGIERKEVFDKSDLME